MSAAPWRVRVYGERLGGLAHHVAGFTALCGEHAETWAPIPAGTVEVRCAGCDRLAGALTRLPAPVPGAGGDIARGLTAERVAAYLHANGYRERMHGDQKTGEWQNGNYSIFAEPSRPVREVLNQLVFFYGYSPEQFANAILAHPLPRDEAVRHGG